MRQLFTHLSLVVIVLASLNASAQRMDRRVAGQGQAATVTSTAIWTEVPAQQAPPKSLMRATLNSYRVYQLNAAELRTKMFALSTDPANGEVMSFPMPDGTFRAYKVWQTPMMPDRLAARYPNIRTFTAVAVDDAHATAKLDMTELGFHAAFFSGDEMSLIDPYDNLNDGYYIVHDKKEENRPMSQRMICEVKGENDLGPAGAPMHTMQSKLPATDLGSLKIPAAGLYSGNPTVDKDVLAHEMAAVTINGAVKRQYDLALSANHFYCQAATGFTTPTIGQCFSAMTTTMNRVNGVYNREIAVQLNFCANEDTLIWPIVTGSINGTDPFDAPINSDAPTCLTTNQSVVDLRIGTTNYDIGHVFTTGAGGLASVGIVCNSSFKAQGVTGSSAPVGDPFDIDYVCHEMGHQFGSSHTFNNNVDNACTGNASSSHAYEPGSGATIMDYAGICSPDNLQNNSSPYFSGNSLEQIQAHISGSGGSCATTSTSGHVVATVPAFTATYNIPYKTPFELSGPTATGDALDTAITYGWWQWNLGDFGQRLNQTYRFGPIFRSYQPVYNHNRVFPRESTVVRNQTSNSGEKMADTARYLTFKTVVRNVYNGYGAFRIPDDSIHINVLTTGAPNAYAGFRVTSQATTGIVYTGGTTQTINWNVVNTTTAPISCANVTIYMSEDSGYTWPHTIGTFANTGSASVTVPNPSASTSRARFKVKGTGNIFFAINPVPFTVNPGAVTAPITGTFTVCAGATTTLSDATPAGTWSSSNTAIATVGTSSGIVTGVSGGTATITYTAASGPVTAVVTVTALPAPAAITGSSTVCVSLTTPLADATPGGAWSSSNTAVATVNSSGVVTGISAGTANITYTVTNVCGSGTAVKTMTVSAPTAVSPITGTLSVCQGNTTALSDATPGGAWSSTNTAVGTISAAGVVTGIAAGTTTISYAITAGCTSAATAVVTVNALPVATTSPSGTVSICTGGNVTVTASPITAGFTYQWQNSSVNIPGATSTSYTASAAGSYRVLVTSTAGCTGTSAVVTVTVSGSSTVTPSVTVSASPGTNICSSVGAVTYTATPVNGGATPVYQWSVNGTLVGGSTPTYSYTPSNGDVVKVVLTSSLPCATPTTATDSVTMTVTTVATPAVSINPAPNDTVCTGSGVTYNAVPTLGGSSPSYQWTINSIVAGTGPSLTTIPANGDIVVVQMTSTATCITTSVVSSAPLVMTVQSPVAHTATISASATSIAAGTSVTFVAIDLTAGTSPLYQWSINGIDIAGATNVTYVTSSLANGDIVRCKVTSSDPCVLPHTVLSSAIIITVLSNGVSEMTVSGCTFSLMPNPNNGTFTIAGAGNGGNSNIDIVVTNTLGQKVYDQVAEMKNGSLYVHVSLPAGIPSGVYLVTVIKDGEKAVFRTVTRR